MGTILQGLPPARESASHFRWLGRQRTQGRFFGCDNIIAHIRITTIHGSSGEDDVSKISGIVFTAFFLVSTLTVAQAPPPTPAPPTPIMPPSLPASHVVDLMT